MSGARASAPGEARAGRGGPAAESAGRALEVEGSKERIHAVARRLFARYGYDGVSLQRIADEVGLHKSSLFHHYRGKLELFREVAEGTLAQVLQRLDALRRDEPPTLETLLEVTDGLVDLFAEEPHTARLLMRVVFAPRDSALDGAVGSEEDSPIVDVYDRVGGWLDRARKSGAIRWVSVRHTLYNLYGLILFHPAAAAEEPNVVGPSAFAPRAVAVRKRELRRMLRGLLEPEPEPEA